MKGPMHNSKQPLNPTCILLLPTIPAHSCTVCWPKLPRVMLFFFYLKSLFVCLGAFKKILKMLAQWFNTSSPTLKANQKEPVNEAEKSPLNIYVYVTHSSTLVFVIFCYNTPDLGYITISVSPSH